MKVTGPYGVVDSRVYYGDANGQAANVCKRASIQLATAAVAGCIRDPEGALYK